MDKNCQRVEICGLIHLQLFIDFVLLDKEADWCRVWAPEPGKWGRIPGCPWISHSVAVFLSWLYLSNGMNNPGSGIVGRVRDGAGSVPSDQRWIWDGRRNVFSSGEVSYEMSSGMASDVREALAPWKAAHQKWLRDRVPEASWSLGQGLNRPWNEADWTRWGFTTSKEKTGSYDLVGIFLTLDGELLWGSFSPATSK